MKRHSDAGQSLLEQEPLPVRGRLARMKPDLRAPTPSIIPVDVPAVVEERFFGEMRNDVVSVLHPHPDDDLALEGGIGRIELGKAMAGALQVVKHVSPVKIGHRKRLLGLSLDDPET